ncbi:MAG: FHA domain-containing protein [Thermoguttaceae bacterium]|nr:FHA domain-containing protein [Thermoguttaceae bacterium]MDW8079744.1 FHA domain-containing protein [Thermoguttaceae bacterium]
MYGQLNPVGGGDPIPLLKTTLLIGRRETCDVVLRFPNVSAHHCELFLKDGYWYVRDLDSRNGTRVNGTRVTQKRLDPGDILAVASHKYRIDYSPQELGAVSPPPPDPVEADILGKSLLERAGLDRGLEDRVRCTRPRKFGPLPSGQEDEEGSQESRSILPEDDEDVQIG